jgi:hypothetical protein
MTGPAIENSDRGITLNKTLAWTMLVALVSLVWYGGSTVAGVNHTVTQLAAAAAADRAVMSAVAGRVGALEVANARGETISQELRRGMEEIKAAQRETNALLREITSP